MIPKKIRFFRGPLPGKSERHAKTEQHDFMEDEKMKDMISTLIIVVVLAALAVKQAIFGDFTRAPEAPRMGVKR